MKVANCVLLVRPGSRIEMSPEETINGSFTGNVAWPLDALAAIPPEYLEVGAILANNDEVTDVDRTAEQL